jgi:hypothetical protein
MIDSQDGCSPEICTVHSGLTEMGGSTEARTSKLKTEGAAKQSVTITMVDSKSDQIIVIPGFAG